MNKKAEKMVGGLSKRIALMAMIDRHKHRT